MSRPLRLLLVVTLSLLLLAAAGVGVAALLLGSQAGLRFAAGQVQQAAGDVVAWSRLEGSLLGPLRIEGLRLTVPGVDLTVEKLSLSWQPAALLGRTVRVDALEGSGIRVVLSPVEDEAESAAFDPGNIPLPVNVDLAKLGLGDLRILQQGQEPVDIERIVASARLSGRELVLRDLTVRMPRGGLSAAAATSLETTMPLELTLSWDWRVDLPDDPNDPASSGHRSAPLAGDLSLDGEVLWSEGVGFDLGYRLAAGGIAALGAELPDHLAATGEVSGEQRGDALQLRALSLGLEGTPLHLRLAGAMEALSAEPRATLTLDWRGLQWPLQAEEPDVVSARGSLDFEGGASDYTLALEADVAGREVPDSAWSLSGEGDLTRLSVGALSGRVLGGRLDLDGDVWWDPAPRWDLRVRGNELDIAQLQADVPGTLALSLASSGDIDPESGLRARVELQELDGILMNYPLRADGRFAVAGENLQIDTLNLASGNNTLTASGLVSTASLGVDWQLSARDPAALLPAAGGDLTARGTVSGSAKTPYIELEASGNGLSWETYAVPVLELSLSAGTDAAGPLALKLDIGEVLDGENTLLSSLHVQASGTNESHRLDGRLTTATEELRLGMEGGLDPQLTAWDGELSSLSLASIEFGEWVLTNPAPLALGGDRASLGDSCLRYRASGQLCVAASWLPDGESELQARLQGLPVADFVSTVTGALDGELSAALAASGELRVDSAITLGEGEVLLEDARPLTHGGGDLDLEVGDSGLLAKLQVAAPEQGVLQANLELPALKALPLPEEQPVSGSVQAVLPDLSGLAAWVPELGSSAGRLAANVGVAGSLSNPRVQGIVALEEGAATVPLAGLKLRDIELRAISDREQPGRLDILGSVQSGPGRMELSGVVDLLEGEANLFLEGERFQVYDTVDARALLSPDLQIGWQDNSLRLRGQLLIPEAAITPKIQLSPATLSQGQVQEEIPGQVIAPSSDVVVIGETLEYEPAVAVPDAPFRIDSQVRVQMGDYVWVRAVGFVSRIAGTVDFTNLPEQEELVPIANGRFSLRDGTFRAFGQNLEIETGHLIFANVPATEPELNLRAVRWIDNDPQVTAAGVLVTGPLTQPVLELFSRPQLETSEIQSYLLTGSSPRSRDNVLGIGTYVSRRIYVGYGYNMLERTSEFNSLFNVSPRFGVGSSVGEADNNINMTITYEH